jgi:hypothetical protein
MSRLFLRACMLAGAAGSTLALALPAAATANTERHFFSRDISFKATHADGQPLSQDARPAPGDRFVSENALFEGTPAHHGEKVIGSARLACEVVSDLRVRCNGVVALHNGKLLAQHVLIKNFFSNEPTVVEINGGTGDFAGARGFVRAVSVGESTEEFTIVLRESHHSASTA